MNCGILWCIWISLSARLSSPCVRRVNWIAGHWASALLFVAMWSSCWAVKLLFQLFQHVWKRAIRERFKIVLQTSFLLKFLSFEGMVLVGIPLAGTDPIPSSFAVKVWFQFVTPYPQGLHFCISSNWQGDSSAKKLKRERKKILQFLLPGMEISQASAHTPKKKTDVLDPKATMVLKHLKLIN